MGYEEIPPGQAIQAHRHPAMDEIIFVHAKLELDHADHGVGDGGTARIGDLSGHVRGWCGLGQARQTNQHRKDEENTRQEEARDLHGEASHLAS